MNVHIISGFLFQLLISHRKRNARRRVFNRNILRRWQHFEDDLVDCLLASLVKFCVLSLGLILVVILCYVWSKSETVVRRQRYEFSILDAFIVHIINEDIKVVRDRLVDRIRHLRDILLELDYSVRITTRDLD